MTNQFSKAWSKMIEKLDAWFDALIVNLIPNYKHLCAAYYPSWPLL